MKRIVFLISVLFATLTMQAQDQFLQKYTTWGDVNTIHVTKNLMDHFPTEHFSYVPGLSMLLPNMESMTALESRGDEAGKKMGKNIPSQLARRGYETCVDYCQDKQKVTVMRSTENPSNIVLIVYKKPHATVLSMKGRFSDELIQAAVCPPQEEEAE